MKLKVWAGNAGEQGLSTIVAATSQRQAVELLGKHFKERFKVTMYEFRGGWWPRTNDPGLLMIAIHAGVWQLRGAGAWTRVGKEAV